MIDAVVAIALNGAGLAAIYCAWRECLRGKRLLLTVGWFAVLAAAVFWCRFAGIEFGIVYAALFTTLAAWAAVVVNHELRARKGTGQDAARNVVPDSATVARNIARFVVAVPIAALTSALVGVVIVTWLPLGTTEAMAIAVLGIPLLWGIASYWACADQQVRRPTLYFALAGVVSAAVLYVG